MNIRSMARRIRYAAKKNRASYLIGFGYGTAHMEKCDSVRAQMMFEYGYPVGIVRKNDSIDKVESILIKTAQKRGYKVDG
jgi:hypothetical protein